ncbi:WD repeat-containing protein 82, partial [Pseudolycoriella hygida]
MKVFLNDEVVRSFKVVKYFPEETDRINAIDISPNGELLVSCSADDVVSVYSCELGVRTDAFHTKKYGADLIQFADKDLRVIHSSTKVDDKIRYLSLSDYKYFHYFNGHVKKVVSLCVSHKQNTFLSTSLDKTLRLWDLRLPNCQHVINFNFVGRPTAAYDPEGLIFAVGVDSEFVRMYDSRMTGKAPFNTFKLNREKECEWTTLKFSHDGKIIMISTNGSVTRLFDAFYGTPLHTLTGYINNQHASIESSFSADSRFVFSGSSDGRLHAWNAATGHKICVFSSNHHSSLQCVKFNPKYAMLSTACSDVAFWLPATVNVDKIVSLLGIFLYITCSRKYKLNWFEKNLLETADEHQELNESQEALVCPSIPYNIDTHDTMSIHSINKSPGSTDDPAFWVPPIQRQSSACPSDCNIQSADESVPGTPTSPTSSHHSIALSIGGTQQQARKPSIPENSRGAIHLTIVYDPNAGILNVRLIEAQDLQPRDFSGTADPYAKIRLLPDKSNVWQTRIHKRTLNPVFDEDFVFEERPNIIGRRTIEILLYDFDAYSRHSSHNYVIPTKCVKNMSDMPLWEKSEAYYDIVGFINSISNAVQGIKNTVYLEQIPVVQNLLNLFEKLSKMVDDTPPVDQPQRFGNKAYRDWFQKLQTNAKDLLADVLPEDLHPAIVEISVYFIESFGNPTRIDYGTGHELAFIMFLCCLFKIGALTELDKTIFNSYLIFVRKLQLTYRMEPAGSHGVWSLDDFQFVPFIWGSAQFAVDSPIRPNEFLEEKVINEYKDHYMFISCIDYINKIYVSNDFAIQSADCECHVECCYHIGALALHTGFETPIFSQVPDEFYDATSVTEDRNYANVEHDIEFVDCEPDVYQPK